MDVSGWQSHAKATTCGSSEYERGNDDDDERSTLYGWHAFIRAALNLRQPHCQAKGNGPPQATRHLQIAIMLITCFT